jgi:SnoaL-like domain
MNRTQAKEEMPMDQQRAQHFAEQWYATWNAHDLTAILDHYADDVEMVSPLVSALTNSDDNTIAGKAALRTYFTAGLEKYPALHFEPIELFVGVDSLVLHYRGGRRQPSGRSCLPRRPREDHSLLRALHPAVGWTELHRTSGLETDGAVSAGVK